MYNEVETANVIRSSVSIDESLWHHIVVMYSTDSFHLYINGSLVASSLDMNMTIFKLNSQQRLTLTIGNPERPMNDGDLYSSMCNTNLTQLKSNQSVIGVDNLRFYSRQLKEKEIDALAREAFNPTSYFFD